MNRFILLTIFSFFLTSSYSQKDFTPKRVVIKCCDSITTIHTFKDSIQPPILKSSVNISDIFYKVYSQDFNKSQWKDSNNAIVLSFIVSKKGKLVKLNKFNKSFPQNDLNRLFNKRILQFYNEIRLWQQPAIIIKTNTLTNYTIIIRINVLSYSEIKFEIINVAGDIIEEKNFITKT